MPERRAVVTGGAKGIGLAVSLRLARDGHQVTALGRDAQALAALRGHAGGMRGTLLGVACDVTDEAAVNATFGDLGVVDILVNNAGMAGSAPLARTSLDDWERHLRVNVTGAFLCTRAVLPGMRERGFGRVVAVGSIASVVGAPYIAAYAASKHALLGLMRCVAAEVRGSGVTANCVCPTYVRGAMTERSVAHIRARTGRSAEEATAAILAASPLGRLVEPDEVAEAVAYLVSDGAAAVNGQSIILDGGGIQQ